MYLDEIFRVPFLKWVTACDLDLTYFSIDQQTCNVILINWMYGSTLFNFTVLPTVNGYNVDTSSYMRSSGWISFPPASAVVSQLVTYQLFSVSYCNVCQNILYIM